VRYTAIHRAWLRSPPAAGASDAVVGCFLRVSSYAADIEAGEPDQRVTRHRPLGRARLAGCRRWSRRAWLAACDTTRPAVEAVIRAGLARWDSDDLVLDGFDVWGQVRTARIRHDAEGARETSGQDAGEDSARDAGARAGEGRGSGGPGGPGRGRQAEETVSEYRGGVAGQPPRRVSGGGPAPAATAALPAAGSRETTREAARREPPWVKRRQAALSLEIPGPDDAEDVT
jgi:hypothetical protein